MNGRAARNQKLGPLHAAKREFETIGSVVCQNPIQQNWIGSRPFRGQQHRKSPVFGIGQTILYEAADTSVEQKTEA
jgi:hypothetical protein